MVGGNVVPGSMARPFVSTSEAKTKLLAGRGVGVAVGTAAGVGVEASSSLIMMATTRVTTAAKINAQP